jgi:hypothetical protein
MWQYYKYWKRGHHQALVKEIVHHIDKADRVDVFKGIQLGYALTPNVSIEDSRAPPSAPGPPHLLIITRPQHSIDYPLWREARDVWAARQPSWIYKYTTKHKIL